MAARTLYHIFVGTKFVSAVRAENEKHAVCIHADSTGTSRLIYNAKPAATVQELKQPKQRQAA
jgi:hypothetical protein